MEPIRELVSITIPFYNAERFLRETIDSVFSQSYTNWELLLADDGSTDRSSEIARTCALRHPNKVRYLEHPDHLNRGVNATRNLGARNARGEFLTFLDSDDVWMPEKLEKNLRSLSEHPEAGFVFGYTEYWYDFDPNEYCERTNHVPPLAPGGRVYAPPVLVSQSYPLGEFGAPCPSSFVLRRWAYELVGGFDECFNPGTFQIYEDIAFMEKLYLHVPGYVSSDVEDRYRCHGFSMTRQPISIKREEAARRFFFRWLNEYLKGLAIKDAEIWRSIRRESWFYVAPLPIAKLLRRAAGRLSRERKRRLSSATAAQPDGIQSS